MLARTLEGGDESNGISNISSSRMAEIWRTNWLCRVSDKGKGMQSHNVCSVNICRTKFGLEEL